MSDRLLHRGRILSADEAEDLPVWTLKAFPAGSEAGYRRRPQTLAEKIAAEQLASNALAARSRGVEPLRPAATSGGAAAGNTAGMAAAPAPARPKPAVDPAEVERIRKEAFDEGYAAGYDSGATAAHDETDRLRSLADGAGAVFEQFEHTLAPALLDLAMAVARQVVRRELSVDSNVVLSVVRDAFAQLTGGETGKQLLLNPNDIQLVRAHLGEELTLGQWKLIEDSRIDAGGCRISTQQSAVDATVETRWKRTVASLGSRARWDDDGEDDIDA